MTSYTDGKRETHNPEGRAYAPVVWDFYNNGCSLRMLNPQTFDNQVWKLCATLQDFMGSFVGTNMYLTPPGTQGIRIESILDFLSTLAKHGQFLKSAKCTKNFLFMVQKYSKSFFKDLNFFCI